MKIRTQLNATAIAIAVISLINMGFVLIEDSAKDAKRVNYTGIFRGATQRSVKLELQDRPNDELIQNINNILAGLTTGDRQLGLILVKDPAFVAALQEARTKWEEVQQLILQSRSNPSVDASLLTAS